MDQKLVFHETLVSLVEYASAQGNQLSKEEIQNHFKDLLLDDAQYDLIYSYLANNKISVDGYEVPEETIFTEPADTEKDEENRTPSPEKETKESEEELSFVKMYLKELESIPPATEDEKSSLIEQLSQGSAEVANRLVELHLEVVASLAESKRGQGVTFGDLIQEGNMGLIQAVSQYEPSFGDFKIYIEKEIAQALEQAINSQVSSDRIGQHLADRLNQLDEVTKDLSEKLDRTPEISELAEAMSLSEDEVSRLLKTSLDTLSVNEDTQITSPEEATPEVKQESDPLTWRVNKK